MLIDRPLAASGSSVPVRCSDCLLPFDPRDAHRQMRTLDGPLALCSDCTWRLEHPGDARRASPSSRGGTRRGRDDPASGPDLGTSIPHGRDVRP